MVGGDAVRNFSIAHAFFAKGTMCCFILILGSLKRIFDMRNFVRNSSLLCKSEQQGKNKINEISAQHAAIVSD